jgi:hypothetical protein
MPESYIRTAQGFYKSIISNDAHFLRKKKDANLIGDGLRRNIPGFIPP